MSKYLVKGNKIFNGIIPRYQNLIPTTLYDNPSGSNGTITLSDNITNYSYVEIYFRTNDGAGFRGSQKIEVVNGNNAVSLQ